ATSAATGTRGSEPGFGAAPGVALATLRTLTGSVRRQVALKPSLGVARLPVRTAATTWFLPAPPGDAGAHTAIARVRTTGAVAHAGSIAAAAVSPVAPPPAAGIARSVTRSATPRPSATPPGAPTAVPASLFPPGTPTLLAMSDLLAATRGLPQAVAFEGQRSLATAFGASEEIRPASGVLISAPTRASGTRATPGGSARPGPAGPGGTRPAGYRAGQSTLLPAPPPISIRRPPRAPPP